jgi:hypothetical protein
VQLVYSKQKHDKTVVQERGVIDLSESLIVDILLADCVTSEGECAFTEYLPDRTWYFCAESEKVRRSRARCGRARTRAAGTGGEALGP